MDFKDVESARKEYKEKIMHGIWVTVGIIAVIGILSFLSTGAFVALLTLPLIIISFAIVAIIFTTREQAKKYKDAYKSYFVEKNLAKTFTDLKYSHEMGLSRSVLSATQMIDTGDVYGSNDLTTGKYKDVAFTQADVHIQEKHTDSDGNTQYVTIFKGRFMIFEFPKKFSFRLEVVEKGFGAAMVPSKNKTNGRKFEKVKLESSEFNKMFRTFAEDGFEAFYLLDPAFIDNILKLGNEYKGKLLLCFLENRLVVGLKDGKDAFEPPSIFKEIDETAESEKINKDIRLITDFVDKLKLDRKLFK